MTGVTAAVAVAAVFVWLGMVLSISFLEAPLKFRAPGITIPLGLGIGRLVFRALNVCELALAVVIAVAVLVGRPGPAVVVALPAVGIVLLVQLLVVRPRLNQRTDALLAADRGDLDGEAPRSRTHLAYVALELIKVVGLLVSGILLSS